MKSEKSTKIVTTILDVLNALLEFIIAYFGYEFKVTGYHIP